MFKKIIQLFKKEEPIKYCCDCKYFALDKYAPNVLGASRCTHPTQAKPKSLLSPKFGVEYNYAKVAREEYCLPIGKYYEKATDRTSPDTAPTV